jgi:hypothetical protein
MKGIYIEEKKGDVRGKKHREDEEKNWGFFDNKLSCEYKTKKIGEQSCFPSY